MPDKVITLAKGLHPAQVLICVYAASCHTIGQPPLFKT